MKFKYTALFAALSILGLSSSVQADGLGTIDESLHASSNHNSKIDDLNRKKELLELENSVSRLELDKEKTDSDIRKLKAGGVIVKGIPSGALPGSEPIEYIQGPAGQKVNVKKQEKKDMTLDYVFVTRVYGIGKDREVTTYFKNSIFTGKAGAEVVEGIRIKEVTDNGAVFTYKGKSRIVSLTTQQQAYERTKELDKAIRDEEKRAADKDRDQNDSSQMAQEIVMPGNRF